MSKQTACVDFKLKKVPIEKPKKEEVQDKEKSEQVSEMAEDGQATKAADDVKEEE